MKTAFTGAMKGCRAWEPLLVLMPVLSEFFLSFMSCDLFAFSLASTGHLRVSSLNDSTPGYTGVGKRYAIIPVDALLVKGLVTYLVTKKFLNCFDQTARPVWIFRRVEPMNRGKR